MTLLFWTILIVMSGTAVAFVIFPLLRQSTTISLEQRNALNIAIYKERLAELEQEDLPPLVLTQMREELEKTLAQELEMPPTPAVSAPTQQVNVYTSLAITAIFPALAIGGYLYLQKPNQPLLEAAPDNIEMLVEQAALRLQKQPDDIIGWQVLARSYVALERYSEAIQAYKHLLSVVGDQDPVLLTDFAEALALENGGQWQGRPNELLKTALNLDATAQKTLWFSGVSAIQRADYPSALNYWQQLLTQISPAETEKIQLLQRQIANLQTFIQSETTTFPAPTSPVVNLTVQVSLASDFQNLVKPTDNVFIYARAPNGSAMPLVIVKKTVADLPLTVTLNQETVVIPNVNLTDFKEVTLVARVAKSGQVTPQPGDLQGLLTPISIHESNPVILVINEMIP